MIKRLNKKCILSLSSPSKCSFTLSKLRFFGLRKPKTTSFYSTPQQKWRWLINFLVTSIIFDVSISYALGSVNLNSKPPVLRLYTSMSPPWKSTAFLTIERPKPVPPNLRERPLSMR